MIKFLKRAFSDSVTRRVQDAISEDPEIQEVILLTHSIPSTGTVYRYSWQRREKTVTSSVVRSMRSASETLPEKGEMSLREFERLVEALDEASASSCRDDVNGIRGGESYILAWGNSKTPQGRGFSFRWPAKRQSVVDLLELLSAKLVRENIEGS